MANDSYFQRKYLTGVDIYFHTDVHSENIPVMDWFTVWVFVPWHTHHHMLLCVQAKVAKRECRNQGPMSEFLTWNALRSCEFWTLMSLSKIMFCLANTSYCSTKTPEVYATNSPVDICTFGTLGPQGLRITQPDRKLGQGNFVWFYIQHNLCLYSGTHSWIRLIFGNVGPLKNESLKFLVLIPSGHNWIYMIQWRTYNILNDINI